MKSSDNHMCNYNSCKNSTNSPHDNNFCIFHAPNGQKGISIKEFNNLIFQKIEKEDYNFEGYIFPGNIQFKEVISFKKKTNFNYAEFLGDAHFTDIKFLKNAAFRKTRFSGNSKFWNTQFLGVADFFAANFSGDVDFFSARFYRGADFISTEFFGTANFFSAQFLSDVDFHSTQFYSNINFKLAKFLGNSYFSSVKFFKEAYFIENEIKNKMEFENVFFSNDSLFYFQNPKFLPEPKQPLLIIFQKIQFVPLRTFFENFSSQDPEKSVEFSPAILFRYCQMKDIYFYNNYMSYFSFYNSSFEEARFISGEWKDKRESIFKLPYIRKNVVLEETLYSSKSLNSEKKKLLKEKYLLEDLKSFREIASFYGRMKVALDRIEDYQQAGWFYFNEYEMKRLDLKTKLKDTFFLKRMVKLLPYNVYKIFSGYGEKPLWSCWNFCFFSFLFTIGHLLSGLKTGTDKIINYDISFSMVTINALFSGQFWQNFFLSFIYTLYRILPVNFWPSGIYSVSPIGLDGLLWSFANTSVLILLITFIVIGLKRRFRRS